MVERAPKCVNYPQAEDYVAVWRYMSFAKFASLLTSAMLFVPRADQFDDAFENSLPRSTITNHPKLSQSREPIRQLMHHVNQTTYVSCWFEGDQESEAMWKIFAPGKESVAIKSTVGKLREVLGPSSDIRRIRYMSYEDERIDYPSVEGSIFVKRAAFDYEREIRGVVRIAAEALEELSKNRTTPFGLQKLIDPRSFIEEIRVAPQSPDWILKVVIDTARANGVDADVSRSAMDSEPEF